MDFNRMLGIVSPSNLGRCGFCIRSAFLAALVVGFAAAAAQLSGGSLIAAVLAGAAVMLALLWLAHLVAYSARAIAGEKTKAPLGEIEHLAGPTRRDIAPGFAKAFLGIALASMLPAAAARAQCVQPPITCTQNSDCKCSGCCAQFGTSQICQPSC